MFAVFAAGERMILHSWVGRSVPFSWRQLDVQEVTWDTLSDIFSTACGHFEPLHGLLTYTEDRGLRTDLHRLKFDRERLCSASDMLSVQFHGHNNSGDPQTYVPATH